MADALSPPLFKCLAMDLAGPVVLNSWQKMLITVSVVGTSFYLAWKTGYSPLEMISEKADRGFITTLHNRFGKPEDR
ncbi:MAG: hypothetical protein D3903_10950 [Candidatus Electrothrix sp. GM3_4]|nr:hypothetical protein [Candidatus Electrothrix sp. GM3_4]